MSYKTTLDSEGGALTAIDIQNLWAVPEVLLNNKSIRKLWHPPWCLDLSPHLIAGRNQLEIRVTNVLKRFKIPFSENQNELMKNPSGLKGPVEIKVYQKTSAD